MDENNSQLELFSKSTAYSRQDRAGSSFFGRVRGYEKAILLVIALIITAIAAYSMGVEKGRRLSLPAGRVVLQTAVLPADNTPVQVNLPSGPRNIPAARQVVPALPAVAAQHSDEAGGYTIQLASFTNRSFAQKELQALKKKGFSALILSRGKYVVLCVGSFASKESAQPMLSEFKKRYKTCCLRRL